MKRKLILCLGNPGPDYQYTRHNVGWLFGDALREHLRAPLPRENKKFHALVTASRYQDEEVIIAYPTTFMNDSGLAAAAITNFYQLDPASDLLVVHDDLDICVGRYKLTRKLPHTHNGLASVKNQLGTDQFTCLRLGVDDRNGDRRIAPIDYVLMKFSSQQLGQLTSEVFPAAIREVLAWL